MSEALHITSTVSSSDHPILDAMAGRRKHPIRLRIQPQLLQQGKEDIRAHYVPWRGVHWTIEVTTLAEARALRDVLANFLWQISQEGIEAVRDKLSPAPAMPRAVEEEETEVDE